MNWVWIFLGGGIGSVLRFGLSHWVMQKFGTLFPVGTVASNVMACLIMGIALFFIQGGADKHPFVKFFVLIGICGGFSTFSTFSLETVMLAKEGLWAYAFANIGISIVLCVFLLWILVQK